VVAAAVGLGAWGAQAQTTIRVATFNLQDVRTADLLDGNTPRLRRLAEVIQRIRPNVILLNEIAYDMPGGPGFVEAKGPGDNARRFAEFYLKVPQASDVRALAYRPFMAAVNTGVASGFDLDRDGKVTTSFPTPGSDAAAARAYGQDCWGYGEFPGQYGMALLVDERLEIVRENVRTFQKLPWSYMDGAYLPTTPEGEAWFDEEELRYVRLSSKSHWDVPVKMPDGAVVHFLCSHPTPPAFDGAEMRNRKRNHDEIRLWADYVQDTGGYIVDDAGVGGGLLRGSSFVILGDLNADPARGDSFKDPIGRLLGSVKRINMEFVPRRVEADGAPAASAGAAVQTDVTSSFGLRVDYVLPSTDLRVVGGGVWTALPSGATEFPSDHYPVWVEITVPGP
jgi:endonuclease/exonuclease/phosphatase family metal-dependent hydrolase